MNICTELSTSLLFEIDTLFEVIRIRQTFNKYDVVPSPHQSYRKNVIESIKLLLLFVQNLDLNKKVYKLAVNIFSITL